MQPERVQQSSGATLSVETLFIVKCDDTTCQLLTESKYSRYMHRYEEIKRRETLHIKKVIAAILFECRKRIIIHTDNDIHMTIEELLVIVDKHIVHEPPPKVIVAVNPKIPRRATVVKAMTNGD